MIVCGIFMLTGIVAVCCSMRKLFNREQRPINTDIRYYLDEAIVYTLDTRDLHHGGFKFEPDADLAGDRDAEN